MINIATFKKIALSFAETNEQPHFEKISFRVGKKIFATYDSKNNRACIKLSEADQHIFCLYDKSIIFPVPINGENRDGHLLISQKLKSNCLPVL
jgi:predicted DNA-binding protein (MmcQ/YjbR family)